MIKNFTDFSKAARLTKDLNLHDLLKKAIDIIASKSWPEEDIKEVDEDGNLVFRVNCEEDTELGELSNITLLILPPKYKPNFAVNLTNNAFLGSADFDDFHFVSDEALSSFAAQLYKSIKSMTSINFNYIKLVLYYKK